jgi:type I restriction-modification system DNA methylase subunit
MCRILTSAEKYVYGLCCSTGAQLICAYKYLTSAEKYVYGLCCSTGAQLICAYKYNTSGKGKKP